MAHERFFHTQRIRGDELVLEGDELFHLSRVLRKKTGDTVWVVDGKGNAFHTRITAVGSESSTAAVIRRYPEFGEPLNRISLAVGIIKAAHWDILLEKAVELGVHAVYPLNTRYTVRTKIKTARAEKIMLSAVKQCGRSRIPQLHPPADLKGFLRNLPESRVYICDNQEAYPPLSTPGTAEDAVVLVGPEGGFHPAEVQAAVKAGAEPVLLSKRRLRTETACIRALDLLVRE